MAKKEKKVAQEQLAEEMQHMNAENPVNGTKTNSKKDLKIPDYAKKFPEHYIKLALIIRNNSEIRRFTSLGIINYLNLFYSLGIINNIVIIRSQYFFLYFMNLFKIMTCNEGINNFRHTTNNNIFPQN